MDMLISNKLNQKQERSKSKDQKAKKKNSVKKFLVIFFYQLLGDCRVGKHNGDKSKKGHRGATN